MLKLGLCSIALSVFLATNVAAQDQPPVPTWDAPEFGKISEIAHLTQAYVYCEDLKVREQLVRELQKEPALVIVDRIDDADFVTSKTTTINGELRVFTAGSVDERNRVHQRIVWSTSKDRASNLGKNPLVKATKAFLEDYRRARLAITVHTTDQRNSEAEAKPAVKKKEKKWHESDKP